MKVTECDQVKQRIRGLGIVPVQWIVTSLKPMKQEGVVANDSQCLDRPQHIVCLDT